MSRRHWRAGCASLLLSAAALLSPVAMAAGPAPARLEATLLDGSRFSLADRLGAITLVAIWSPESMASRKSIGELQRFRTAFGGSGIEVVAVATSADRDRLRSFGVEHALDLPLATLGEHDLGPLPEQSLPLVYVFDRDGRIASVHRGLFRLRDLEQAVTPLRSP